MQLRALRRTHPSYNPAVSRRYRALFEGGQRFCDCIKELLPKHDVEPADVYKKRCDAATYTNYCGSIAGYFASWLFSSALSITADPSTLDAGSQPDPYYAQFKEDCDGNGSDFDAYLRARFVDAIVCGYAYWRVKFPKNPEGTTVTDRAAWEQLGLGRGMVHTICDGELTNWRKDSQGELMWAVEHSSHRFIRDFASGTEVIKETWTLWRRPDQVPSGEDQHRRWAIEYPSEKVLPESTDIPEVTNDDPPGDQVDGMPIVCLEMPPELWLMNHLADPQLEIFRKTAALGWAIDRTCYAMPVFHLKSRKEKPRMGAGYYLMLGLEDKLEWPSPPSAPFATIQSYIDSRKDEMYRVANQMAQGVSNNAAAVGRSGQSKAVDNQATEIVLRAYGAVVREAAERTMNLLAIGRDETVRWRVSGMDHYHVTDGASLTEMVAAALPIPMPSQTYQRERAKRLARAQMPDMDEATKASIDKELEAATFPTSVTPDPKPFAPKAPTPPSAGPQTPPTDSAPPQGSANKPVPPVAA